MATTFTDSLSIGATCLGAVAELTDMSGHVLDSGDAGKTCSARGPRWGSAA
jgi:hypothetical protein